jgi:hypothetical protein
MTYFGPHRAWCVIHFDSVSNCSISSSYGFLFCFLHFLFIFSVFPRAFTSSLLVPFDPRHQTNSDRCVKQARVEWEWIFKLNWVTTLLYPISPCRKGRPNYESAQQTVLVNYLYRRFEALCQRMTASWGGKHDRNWRDSEWFWCGHVKAT